MIRVVIEVSDGSALHKIAVRAESIRQALHLASERFPLGYAKVIFPIEPETFFVRERDSGDAVVELGTVPRDPWSASLKRVAS
jgi:hypothetical protein